MRKLFCMALLATCCQASAGIAGSPNSKMSAEIKSLSRSAAGESKGQQEALMQLAILLDTSGSMEGLVDQARYQLWNVVSELAKARADGSPIRLEIAVYQYGTDQVSKSKGCLRQIVGFTEDLDRVSKGLFSLHVGGGDEFCNATVADALQNLEWSDNPNVYKSVFLAGNEYFDQGETTFGQVLPMLKEKAIQFNTIYCGTKYKGQQQWDVAAKLADGIASLIDHNHRLPNIPTPFDAEMRELNEEMNETFVWYGKKWKKAAENQKRQDQNAAKMSDHAFAARMSTKIGHLYHHIEHDLVDALMHKHVKMEEMSEDMMPAVFEAKSPSDRMQYMEEMISRRQTVRRKMADLLTRRQRFLEMEFLKKNDPAKTVLGDALSNAIKEQAKALGYTFDASSSTVASNGS